MQAAAKPGKHLPDAYSKVFDARNRRVRGLSRRNGRFFASLTVADGLGRKSSRMVSLSGVTLDEAKADYARLLTERADDRLRPLGLAPILADYSTVYKQQLAVSGKRPSSVEKETGYLKLLDRNAGPFFTNFYSTRGTSNLFYRFLIVP